MKRTENGSIAVTDALVIGLPDWGPAEIIAWLWRNLVKAARIQRFCLALPRHSDPGWMGKGQQRQDFQSDSCGFCCCSGFLSFVPVILVFYRSNKTPVEVELSVSMIGTSNQTEHLLKPSRWFVWFSSQFHNAPDVTRRRLTGGRRRLSGGLGRRHSVAANYIHTALPSFLPLQFRRPHPSRQHSCQIGWVCRSWSGKH